ncbi:mechanosensitive ion channel family protein [Neorhizobium galegae]|uniref:mechanosensitive ion channel family protein n=1 Tax=Neorhizobium galegae TaxID=399 RepID=UPI00062212F9|nr:mechanosensitive ion channel family protein [Neorhizobium galegae]MCQ1779640.1 mechanosensitive ion channel family protein [Neorhizobium galegae]MCQ1798208.1 mechanosensitive ion channel family protein [Neorhizobium galegae]CDZ28366.1 MscS Mechanosensitive ion channel [Neorhizobium galegae bv. officinalis]
MERFIQEFRNDTAWLPDWLVSCGVMAVAFLIGLAIQRFGFRFLTRLVENRDLFWRSLVSRTRRPMRLAILTWTLSLGATIAPLSAGQGQVIRHLLLLGFIVVVGWMAKIALHVWMIVYLRRFKLDAEDNLLARTHVTQSRIAERIASVMIVAITIAAMLMTFPAVQQYGVSLLASAGVAGVVLGLALQPVLKNIFAGIQLAITQPIRIDDALIVEGEWGNVEEITSTYVVVKLWDWRRMILPLSYFIETPFQNWTRDSSELIGTVMIYLDYSVPVNAVRRKGEEIAATSKLWDKRVVAVQVTDFRENVMEIRILVSASNAPRTFDLRCEVREKIIDFIQREYPASLPRVRAEGAASGARTAAGKVVRHGALQS